jgi:hypothetical protein
MSSQAEVLELHKPRGVYRTSKGYMAIGHTGEQVGHVYFSSLVSWEEAKDLAFSILIIADMGGAMHSRLSSTSPVEPPSSERRSLLLLS